MRESRSFGERAKVLASDEARRKYYLIYEGSDTEALYFATVDAMREKIGIHPLIELVPLVRSYSERGWSNPKKILNRIIDNLEENKTACISYETLLNRLMDYFYEADLIKVGKAHARGIWLAMCRICTEVLQVTLSSDVGDIEAVCDTIISLLYEGSEIERVVSDISHIISERSFTYAEGFDRICLIVDRDRQSFVSTPENDQYGYVVSKCREKGFGLYITNPCFEFWLLLHFDQVFSLDRDKLLENPKVTAKRRYVEHVLRKICPGYEKSSYRAEKLIQDIDKAILNEKEFCEDIEGLKHKIGSNIGLLIEDMRKP